MKRSLPLLVLFVTVSMVRASSPDITRNARALVMHLMPQFSGELKQAAQAMILSTRISDDPQGAYEALSKEFLDQLDVMVKGPDVSEHDRSLYKTLRPEICDFVVSAIAIVTAAATNAQGRLPFYDHVPVDPAAYEQSLAKFQNTIFAQMTPQERADYRDDDLTEADQQRIMYTFMEYEVCLAWSHCDPVKAIAFLRAARDNAVNVSKGDVVEQLLVQLVGIAAMLDNQTAISMLDQAQVRCAEIKSADDRSAALDEIASKRELVNLFSFVEFRSGTLSLGELNNCTEADIARLQIVPVPAKAAALDALKTNLLELARSGDDKRRVQALVGAIVLRSYHDQDTISQVFAGIQAGKPADGSLYLLATGIASSCDQDAFVSLTERWFDLTMVKTDMFSIRSSLRAVLFWAAMVDLPKPTRERLVADLRPKIEAMPLAEERALMYNLLSFVAPEGAERTDLQSRVSTILADIVRDTPDEAWVVQLGLINDSMAFDLPRAEKYSDDVVRTAKGWTDDERQTRFAKLLMAIAELTKPRSTDISVLY